MDIKIKDAADHVDKMVTIKGWLFNKRGSGKIHFLQLRDGTGNMQGIVFQGDSDEETFKKADDLTAESSVIVGGKVTKHPKKEEYELQVKSIEIVQLAHGDYPITNKEHGPDFLLEHRHLWLRSTRQAAIQRVRHTVSMGIYEYFDQNGFTRIDSPILTPAACEGTTELFELDYFEDTKAYLSQSGQLYLEAAMFSLGNVYDFGPVFRAEKSKTRRHLNEFWMMDAEMAFTELEDNLQVQEGLICHIVQKVLKECKRELAILERDTEDLEKIKAPFYRVHHKDAVKKMKELGLNASEDDDFGAEEEIAFADSFDKPVFVTHYPAKVKAFYMKRDKIETDRVHCADLLVARVGELVGGSQREDDYDTLVKRIEEHKLPRESFEWYLDLRKYGSVPHGGFGLGLERTVSWL
ncbi:asparagine--tRNA ligase, partial [Patescibacteria group bacterium]|nr:asparagine--tRNA ligase [Patescibacteria group bacterium]